MPANLADRIKHSQLLYVFTFAFFMTALLCLACLVPQEAQAKIVKIKLSAIGDCALCTDTNESEFDDYFNKYGPD